MLTFLLETTGKAALEEGGGERNAMAVFSGILAWLMEHSSREMKEGDVVLHSYRRRKVVI